MRFFAGFLTAATLISFMYTGLFGGAFVSPSGLVLGSLALWCIWLLALVIRWIVRLKTGDNVVGWKVMLRFAGGFLTAALLIGVMYSGLFGGHLTPNGLRTWSIALWLVWVVVFLIQERRTRSDRRENHVN